MLWAAAFSSGAYAQASADDANKSNNPLNLAPSFNIQDYYTPSLFGVGGHTNDLLLRPTVPVGPLGPIGVPEIFRATVPISTRPDPTGGYNTGLGDINLFDIFRPRPPTQVSAPANGKAVWQPSPSMRPPRICSARWFSGNTRLPVKAAGRLPSRLLRSRSPSSTCPAAGTSVPPVSGASTCSTARTTSPSALARARHGRAVRPSTTRSSNRSIPSPIPVRACRK
jgi:hypothetical protein